MFRRIREVVARFAAPGRDAASGAGLADRYAGLGDQELHGIAGAGEGEYTPAAVAAAHEELRRRGIAATGATAAPAAAAGWIAALRDERDDPAPDEATIAGNPVLRAASQEHQDTRSGQALRTLEELAAAHPRCAEPLLHLAEALRRTGRDAYAEALLLQGYARVRKKSTVAALLGSLYFARDDLLQAVRWYARAVAGAPEPSWAPLLYLAGIYHVAGLSAPAAMLGGAANRAHGHSGVALAAEWTRQAERAAAGDREGVADVLHALWSGYLEARVTQLLRAP